ncbi:reverse transcriptase domain-containing protein [Tanacetum coccineum]
MQSGHRRGCFREVGTFFFPANFVVVDYVADPRVPLILGRPFLRTARALIDVHGEQMTLRHDDQSVTFKVGDTKTFSYNIIESVLTASVINSDPNLPPSPVCEINVPDKIKSSCEDSPDLELKDLPSHLEYAFLVGDDKLPVIIAKNLKDEDKTTLIKVLKSHKRAIAWKISDIKGIDPQFCTHKILMEENAKPVVQHQRRVNPKIHEVIKQEVIKLLDARLIYPISNNPWEQIKSPPPTTFPDLKNPHQSELEKKEITETFPLETLGMVTFHGDNNAPWFAILQTTMRGILYRADQSVPARCNARRKELEACHNGPTGGHHGANVTAKKYTTNLYQVAKSLKPLGTIDFMDGPFPSSEGDHNIFSWQSITYRNGLKRKRSPPMMPELFANFLNLSSPDLVPLVQS